MSNKLLNSRISAYKKALASGDIQATYQSLVAVIQNLRTNCLKKYKGEFSVANILHGYIDVTYFYLQNDYLKKHKLKLAIVLNHQHVHFELWLLGQTKDVQIHFWEKLKGEEWVNAKVMPQYSISETVLLRDPDFDRIEILFESIHKAFGSLSDKIIKTLEVHDS